MKKILLSLLLMTTFMARSETIIENFTNNPAANGWQTYGDAGLFTWDSINHNLMVNWDSTKPTSYFYHSLSNIIGEQDGFTLDFDLQLSNAVAGGDFGFELAIGFLNFAGATSPDFSRGFGVAPNLVEFDYFPPLTVFTPPDITNNYPPSIDLTMIDTFDNFQFFFDTPPLFNGVTYHFSLDHPAGSTIATTAISTYTNGQLQLYTTLPTNFLSSSFTDYFLDTVSISSYNGDDTDGSISAQGTIANFKVTTAPRPIGNLKGELVGSAWQAHFTSRTNWFYGLERSTDLQSWTPVPPTVSGTGSFVTMQDTNLPPNQVYYRIHASQP